MANVLRIGIVGMGKMGELHLQKYLLMPSVEVVGFVEPNENRKNHISEKYKIRAFNRLSELLFEVDAVSVTSTTETHFINCRQALDAGVHVLVEKPMCDDIDQANQLVLLAKKNSLLLQVGYLERFRLSRLAEHVSFHNIKMIEARWFATELPREKGIDVVADMFVHPLDLVLSFCHEDPSDVRVSGFSMVTDKLDLFESRLEFPSGLIASICVNRVAQHKERRITLYSSTVTATLNFLTNHVDVVRVIDGQVERSRLESEGSNQDVLKLQIEDFVRCALIGSRPLVSAEDGLRVLKTLERHRVALGTSYLAPLVSKHSKEVHVS